MMKDYYPITCPEMIQRRMAGFAKDGLPVRIHVKHPSQGRYILSGRLFRSRGGFGVLRSESLQTIPKCAVIIKLEYKTEKVI